jgi:hypothetical protein
MLYTAKHSCYSFLPQLHRLRKEYVFHFENSEHTMKNRTLSLILFIIPAFAITSSAAEKLPWVLYFRDGSMQCGPYYAKDKLYCRLMQGGEICLPKASVVRTVKIQDCDEDIAEQVAKNDEVSASSVIKKEVTAKNMEMTKAEAVAKTEEPSRPVQVQRTVAAGNKKDDCITQCTTALEKIYKKFNHADILSRCSARCP